MFLEELNKELNEKLHPRYNELSFFELANQYKPEFKKILIRYFQKKGISYPEGTNKYTKSDEINYKKAAQPITPDTEKELKKYGLTKSEIEPIKKPGGLNTEQLINLLIREMPYSLKSESPSEIKKFLEGETPDRNGKVVTKEKRSKILKRFYNNVFDKKNLKFKNIQSSFNIDVDDTFAISDRRGYREDFELPKMEYKGQKFEISIISNSEYFQKGHDLNIKVLDDNENKTYKYKINIIGKNGQENIIKVLDNLWSKVEMALSGEEKEIQVTDTKNNKINKKPKTIADNIRNYLDKWYNVRTLKSGEIKRSIAPDYKKPVDIIITYSSRKNPERSNSISLDSTLTIKYRIKSESIKMDKLKEKYPNIEEWHQKYYGLLQSNKKYTRNRTASQQWSKQKLYNEEHEKFFKRVEMVTKKLLNSGYVIDSSKKAMIGDSGRYNKDEWDEMRFKYFPKIEKQIKDLKFDTVWEKFKEGGKFEKHIENVFYSHGVKYDDIPKWYIKEIFKIFG